MDKWPEENVYIIEHINDIPIIIYKEIQNTTIDDIEYFFNYLNKISNNKKFNLIIDLSAASPPNAELRAYIKSRFDKINHLIISVNIFVGSNFLLKIAAKFIGASIGFKNLNIHSSIDKALYYIKNEI